MLKKKKKKVKQTSLSKSNSKACISDIICFTCVIQLLMCPAAVCQKSGLHSDGV